MQQVLISASAVEKNYHGNRKLANLCASLIEFLTTYLRYEAKISRSHVAFFWEVIKPVLRNAYNFRSGVSNKEDL